MMLGLKIQWSFAHVAMANLIMQDYGICGFARHQLLKNPSQFLLCLGSSFNPSLPIVVVTLIMQNCGIK
jgi:hypothetical protein